MELRKTTKGHLAMKLLQHVFVEDPAVKVPVEETPTSTTATLIVSKPERKSGWTWVPKEVPRVKKQVSFVQNPMYYSYQCMLEMVVKLPVSKPSVCKSMMTTWNSCCRARAVCRPIPASSVELEAERL